ncbi:PrsW family intramembrane metalloprotease [Diaminobutyricibacter tongyongensis]|uniref:PrsW family intramembrane metalloprotease n=1 Tax=Leifsonia tongyongensis TaxID=1268043 RepID=A0A6L9XXW2_9MICO|nr:PrsW family glutamic-type intramembrane protease [Diaminobutyricibacter tongyongensis]NEN05874.1 PrsW family intramembrane metalloprotease [Diaminobutyricibacter tongyongensis]
MATDSTLYAPVAHPHHHHGWWWKTLLSGLALWIVTIIVTATTQNTNLVPTLILLGSFLVPFCVVLFVIERVTGSISTLQLVLAFFVGGILGVLGASILEARLQQSFGVYGLVGLIEEFVKGVLLVIVGWRVTPKTAKQGALLGATIGAGFAAFESAGYAFNAAITSQGIDLTSLLETEVVRAILAPVGHVLWTAILGAVIFGCAHLSDRFRWSWWIVIAYLGGSLLHAAWDSASEIAAFTAVATNGGAMQFLTFYIFGLALTSAAGILTLWLVLRHFGRTEALLQPAT